MLVFKFPIMVFIFIYFICHIHHKLTVTYVTTLDATAKVEYGRLWYQKHLK